MNTPANTPASTNNKNKLSDIVALCAVSFTTLAVAVKPADVVKTLQSPGPFTVFAPTDEAFAKLPKATLKDL